MLSNNFPAPKKHKKGRLAILASGEGTNTEAIIRYLVEADCGLAVGLVVTNKAGAGVLVRAARLGVESVALGREAFAGECREVLEVLGRYDISCIALAGFMQKIGEGLLGAYGGRMVNIHPSLLPRFGGKGMYGNRVHEAVLASGAKETGITIHEVNEEYDAGGIVFQARCPVLAGDTVEELAGRVHELEYAHYGRVIGERWG
jgi:phosphoribosylglycinamide formyltransferase-1